MPRGRHRTKVIQLNRINGNFGLKLVGGSDLKIPPSVAELQPGGAAELSQKIGVGDLLLSIDGRDVHTYSQTDVSKALLKSPDSCQFIFQTNIYIRESVLEIISLKYMQKFKKGGCVPSPNTTNFQDGELCSAFEINSVSRPYGQNSNSAPPAPPKIPEPSPPPSLSSANGTTTDSCTESTGSEHNIEHAQPTSQAQLPLSQRRVSVKTPTSGEEPVLYKLSDSNSLSFGSQTAPSKKDSPTLNLYAEKPGSLADLLEKDMYNPKPQFLRECEANNDFGWHRLSEDSRRESHQELLFSSKYGSVYCESLENSINDDLNSLCSDYSRSTSVISNASSLLSNRESTCLDAIIRKNRSLSSLSLDARLKSKKNFETPNSDHLGRKNNHVHTASDIGPDNYFVTDTKYGSLPQVMRKRSGDKSFANTSKLSAPTSLAYKLEMDSPQLAISPEDMSEIKKKAWKMYKLEDYTDQELCQMLAPDTTEARELGVIYSSFFDFKMIDIVDAFRMYLRHLKLEGESQEQDRIVEFFSKRYHICNPYKIGSADAIHVLVCSLLLLNADLHGQNLGKSMTFKDFYENLMGQCDEKNFSTTLLKECYTSIKKKTLETGSQGVQTSSRLNVRKQEEKKEVIIPIENSMVSVSISTESIPTREGLLYIKNITDAEGKRTSGKQRHWKAFYAQIRGPLLVLWSMADTNRYLSEYRRVYPLTHSLARPCPEYTKRNHALRVNTCQRQIILIDARDLLDMQGWVSAVNLTAALHSSEPMAGALGSSTTFSRPTIPIGPSVLPKDKQIEFLEKTVDELENDLEKYSPDKMPLDELKNKPKIWVKDMLDYRNFLASEVHRYRVYTGCIDLNDKDSLFQYKPVYYISRLLQKEFEPIIEAPEEAVPSPKINN